MIGAAAQYGLMENARRARLGLSVAEYRQQMGELFAPFTKVAAKNPFSASPVERSVEELTTVSAGNRLICDPYPRPMVARDQVNQGAAALLMSVDAAQRLGVPEGKWVYLRGHADLIEQTLVERADLGTGPASVMADREALSVAGIGLGDVATFDLYSCFPVPVFNISDGLGLATDDPRGLTTTGGLPFFGGPGNNYYSMHAIAETVAEMRDKPGQFGLIGANGGIMSKYSVGRLLDRTGRLDAGPKRRAAGRGCRTRQGGRHDRRRRPRNHRDLHHPIRLADDHRCHRRTARLRWQPLPGHHRGRRPGRADVRGRSARCANHGAPDREP